MPASYGQGKKVQAIQSILCCAYITFIPVISTEDFPQSGERDPKSTVERDRQSGT
jgi:hypothetical protein